MLWVSVEEADTYFATRFGAGVWSESWVDKTAVLTTAQGDLENCGRFTFPSVTESGEEPTSAMKAAVCEQALFRMTDPDSDARAALIAQGVSRADVVGEEYDKTKAHIRAGEIPISPHAIGLLRELETGVSYDARIPWER